MYRIFRRHAGKIQRQAHHKKPCRSTDLHGLLLFDLQLPDIRVFAVVFFAADCFICTHLYIIGLALFEYDRTDDCGKHEPAKEWRNL